MSEVKPFISWEERKIVGKSGKVYHIMPEKISSARYVEFEIRSMTQAFKTNLDGILKLISDVEHDLTKGELNCQGNTHTALQRISDFKKGLINHIEYKRTESIEFCALFCIADGEDVTDFSEALIRDKWNDWKEIPNEDFFLLSIKAKMLYSQRFRDILKSETEKMKIQS